MGLKRTLYLSTELFRFFEIMKSTFFFLWMALALCLTVFPNTTLQAEDCCVLLFSAPDSVIPRVFIKGDHEKLEDLLTQQFPKPLLYVFKDNSQNAFAAWANMLWEMEKFSDKIGFDVRGIKAFATFYFDRKGSIRHIAYSLKSNSRYIKAEDLDKFFRQFMANYRMNVNSKYNFQHEFTLSLPYPRLLEKTGE